MTRPGDTPRRLRLASLNLFSGRTSRGLPAGEEALAEAVRRLDVDVLAGQEVDRGQPRSGEVDQTAVIAEAMGAAGARFSPTVLGTPGEPGWTAASPALAVAAAPASPGSLPVPDGPSSGPAYGVCLVSRWPVEQWHELALAPSRGRFPLIVPGRPPRLIWLRDEPRAALAAQLSNGLTVVCTHLSFVPGVNVRQLRQIRHWLEELALPGPVVVLGDLNLPPMPVRRSTGWTPLVSAPTFPGRHPGVQLDHALGVGLPEGTSARGELVAELPVGDHRGVRVVLDLPAS